MTDVIRAYKRGRELFREGMEFSRVMTVAKSMAEHEALVAGYLGEKRRVADLDKWAARFSSTNWKLRSGEQRRTGLGEPHVGAALVPREPA
jgi:hypothetical protein